MPKMTVELRDQQTGNKIPVLIETITGSLFVRPKGMGENLMPEGFGYPIMLEYYEGSIRLVVWSDINQEDPTHTISLDGAFESLRK